MNNIWVKNAADTYADLEKIDPAKATKEQAMMYGSMLAILDHDRLQPPIPPAMDVSRKTVPTSTQSVATPSSSIEMSVMAAIDDELSDAEKYYEWYRRTKDKDYLEIAKQELHHAEILIKHARKDGQPETSLSDYLLWHHSLLAKVV
jgi:hypothetical protein